MKAIEVFEVNFQRAEALLKVHKDTFPVGRPVTGGEADELLRAVIVFAVASLDAYMHKRIVEAVREKLHLNRRVPEKCVALITKNFKEEAIPRELLNIALGSEPHKELERYIESGIKLKTFQKGEQINDALDMMEVRNPWSAIDRYVAGRSGGRRPSTKKFLTDLATRRDRIVHECDTSYVGRYGYPRMASISRTEVGRVLKKLRRFVLAFAKVTTVS